MFDPSAWLMPGFIAFVIVYGLIRRVPVYDAFVRGAKKGVRVAADILPFLVAMLPVIALLDASGAMAWMVRICSPLLTALGLPKEVLPMMLMRPLSGSASLAMLERTLQSVGPDSYAGRVASTLMGSSETIFYTVALYLGAAGVKRSRHAIPVALIAWLAGSVVAGWACTLW